MGFTDGGALMKSALTSGFQRVNFDGKVYITEWQAHVLKVSNYLVVLFFSFHRFQDML